MTSKSYTYFRSVSTGSLMMLARAPPVSIVVTASATMLRPAAGGTCTGGSVPQEVKVVDYEVCVQNQREGSVMVAVMPVVEIEGASGSRGGRVGRVIVEERRSVSGATRITSADDPTTWFSTFVKPKHDVMCLGWRRHQGTRESKSGC